MPTDKGLSLRGSGSHHPYRNWLRDTVQKPAGRGGLAITDQPKAPALKGFALRGTVTVAPPASQANPFSRSSPAKPTVSPQGKTGQRKIAAAFREVHEDEPAIVAKTRRKKGAEAAEKQRTAIALSKARRSGVKIPKR